tara:strand:+ start:852 stop:1751 length:900 start_codon:yes stop_codon:yes gene_type:complete
MMMIGKAVGAGVNFLGDRKRADDRMDQYGKLLNQGKADSARLEKQREGLYSMGPTMRKYMQYAMQDPTSDMQRQEALRSSGTAVGALKAGGARAILGGLGAQQQMAASNMAKIAADEYARKTGAMLNVGQQEQMLRSARRRDVSSDLSLARQQAASALEGKFQAGQDKAQAGTDLFSQLAVTAGNIAGTEFGDLGNSDTASDYFAKLAESGEGDAVLSSILGYQQDPTGGFRRNEKGGKVKKTPGEFSHRKNPIDVMQRGAKIGELTGGEYVLNPEQAAAIARQSDIARKLFNKFDREA